MLEGRFDRFGNLIWFGHPAGSLGAAAEPTGSRFDDRDSIGFQLAHVATDRWMVPHFGIHRWRN